MENINEYADWTLTKWYLAHDCTAPSEKDIMIMILGLAGESGEVLEIIKKKLRDGAFDAEHFKSEMGDVIYYWSRICKAFNILPSEVLDQNINKLSTPRLKMDKHKLLDMLSNKIFSEIGGDSDEDSPFVEGSRSRSLAEEMIQLVLNSGVKK